LSASARHVNRALPMEIAPLKLIVLIVWVMTIGMASGIPVFAQDAPLSMESLDVAVNFGVPGQLPDGQKGEKYLQTGAFLSAENDAIRAAGDGRILFIQDNHLLSGGLPHATGNFTAVAHADGFISLYSGKTYVSEASAKSMIKKGEVVGRIAEITRALYSYYLFRVYDGASRLWVNPAFFIKDLVDRASPRIEEIALLGQDRTIIAENPRKGAQEVPQGNYSLAVSVTDPAYAKGSISGVFRLKAVFDGKVIADRKLDSARITPEGLAFLDLEAPSSRLTDEDGRLLLGKQFIPRGMHALEFSVYDYAGNSSSFNWKFSAK